MSAEPLHRSYLHFSELPTSLRVLYTAVLALMGAGYLFAHHLGEARRDLRTVELGILAAVLVGGGIALRVRRRRRAL